MPQAIMPNPNGAITQVKAISLIEASTLIASRVQIKKTKSAISITGIDDLIAKALILLTGSKGIYDAKEMRLKLTQYGMFYKPLTLAQYRALS